MTTPRIHHTAISVSDLEQSLRFYQQGLGLEKLMEGDFAGPWKQLFEGPGDSLNMTFLGDPGSTWSGILELISFNDGEPGAGERPGPSTGFFLISFYLDVDACLERLHALGFKETQRVLHDGGGGEVLMASVRDPDGVLVELIDAETGAQITDGGN
jgi:catechol 2,3-dioxygenase-like lactoylglutathione lyase family enzyme